MASVYFNSGQGPSDEDCVQRCLRRNDDGDFGELPFNPFNPPSPPLPPPASHPCRHNHLDLVTLLNNAGYQRDGRNVPDGYSISMRGNEPVRVHLDLGSPPERNTRGYLSPRPSPTPCLVSTPTLVVLSVVAILGFIHLLKRFDLRYFIRGLICMLQSLEEKPREIVKDVWTPTPPTPRPSRASTRPTSVILPQPKVPLPPPRPPLLDETDSDLEKDDYQPPSNAPPSSPPLPQLHEDPDPTDAVAFEKNIRRFIFLKLHLEIFFPLGDTFVDSVSKAAAKLRQENPGSTLGKPENLKRLVPLSLYQPVIYCDDSGSMRDRRYSSQRELVQRIARIATAIVPNNYGVELRFINDKFASNLRADEVDEAVARVKPEPQKLSDLGNGLRAKILKPLVYDVLDNPRKRLQRPLLVCIITDGHPYPENEAIFKNNIVECRQRLVAAGYPPTAVMFVVNQIGSEQKALEFLGRLREDPEIRDVLYCTTSRIDKELEELRENERRLDEWLLHMLSTPIMLRLDDGLPQNGIAQELAEAQEELEIVEKPSAGEFGVEGQHE